MAEQVLQPADSLSTLPVSNSLGRTTETSGCASANLLALPASADALSIRDPIDLHRQCINHLPDAPPVAIA